MYLAFTVCEPLADGSMLPVLMQLELELLMLRSRGQVILDYDTEGCNYQCA